MCSWWAPAPFCAALAVSTAESPQTRDTATELMGGNSGQLRRAHKETIVHSFRGLKYKKAHMAQHICQGDERCMWSCLCSVGALAPASSLGAQGVSHPVHSFVEPFTCVMQERAGGGGFAAEGWRGPRAAGPFAARQWTRQSGTGATTLEAPTARAQHDGLPERCGVGWGARWRGDSCQLTPPHP